MQNNLNNLAEKINYIKQNYSLNKIDFSDNLLNEISIEKLKEVSLLINNEEDIIDFFNSICFDNIDKLNDVLDIFYDGVKYRLLIKMINIFSISFIANNINCILLLLKGKNYIKFLDQIIGKVNINYISLSNINKVYLNNKDLIDQLDYNDNEIISNLINFIHLTNYINDELNIAPISIDNLKNYNSYRTTILILILLKEDDFITLNEIDEIILGLNSSTIEQKISSILKVSKSYPLKESILEFIEIFNTYHTEDNLIEYCKFIENQINTIENITKEVEQICAKELVKSFRIILDSEQVQLNGEKFAFLIHKMTGYNNPNLKIKLMDDLNQWKNVKDNNIISTSYINQDFFGMIFGKESILGFSKIFPSSILDMGSCDIYSHEKIYEIGEKTNLSEFMLPNDLINESENYNEVVLRRKYADEVLMPNFILSLDSVTRQDKNLAHFFKTPIVILPRYLYLERMNENLYKMMIKNQLDLMSGYVIRMYFSCGSNEKYLKDYFSTGMMNFRVKEVIEFYKERINEGNKEQIKGLLNNLADSYLYINNANQSNKYETNFAYETMCKKIRKL